MGRGTESDQLTNLMTYTVFHLGAYITLGAAVLAGGALIDAISAWLRLSLICMLIAGMCGGVIASKIPDYATYADFVKDRIGPWGLGILPYRAWATVEHLAFWVGVTAPSVAYLVGGDAALFGGAE